MRTALLHLTALALLAGAVGAGCSRPPGPGPAPEPAPAPAPPARPAAPAYLNMPPDGPAGAPPLLSQTGALADTATLAPGPALIPYEVNVPFWSDGAKKRRWMALPDGGTIHFSPGGEWGFPDGTVFV